MKTPPDRRGVCCGTMDQAVNAILASRPARTPPHFGDVGIVRKGGNRCSSRQLMPGTDQRQTRMEASVSMITRIDHFVLTVRTLDTTCAFYEQALGFHRVDTPNRPTALVFGQQKINVHEVGHTFEPKALTPTPGAGDFCLITEQSLRGVQAHLEACGVAIELGPVERIGALGKMTSLYFRDPDGNLVEVSAYDR